jgi:predicted nucleic acid-binding protein
VIAADTSSMIAFLAGLERSDVVKVQVAIRAEQLYLPPVVVAELLSKPANAAQADYLLQTVAILPVEDGFWERAGRSRRILLSKGLKAKLADTLVAQSCIDASVPLITDDADFRHFATHCGLKLA